MHIPGGSFIFNISKGQRIISDLEKHIPDPPQLAEPGIFHPLHERRIFVLVRNFTPHSLLHSLPQQDGCHSLV